MLPKRKPSLKDKIGYIGAVPKAKVKKAKVKKPKVGNKTKKK